MFILMLVLYAFSLAGCVEASSFNYHPSLAMSLGAGIDPEHPDLPFHRCVDNDGVRKVNQSGAITTKFNVNLVSSRHDLFNQMEISSSLSAQRTFWSASADASYFSEHRFHSDSLVWVIKGFSDYGLFEVINPRLAAFAQKFLDEREYDQFAQTCGKEFVYAERREGLIAAVFSIDNISQEQKKSFETQLQVMGKASIFSAELKAKYASFVQEASRTSRITVSVHAIGGEGISRLSGLVSKTDDLERIKSVMESYMAGLNDGNAAPVEYFANSMMNFGWRGQNIVDVKRRDKVMGQLFHRYTDAENDFKRLESIIDSQGIVSYQSLSDEAFEEYRSQYNAHADYLNTLLEAAALCHDKIVECRLPQHTLSRIKWPIDRVDRCEQIRLQAFGMNLIGELELKITRRTNMIPILAPGKTYPDLFLCSSVAF